MSAYETVTMAIDAQAHVSAATIQLVRFSADVPTDHIRREPDTYRLELSLSPRPGGARACYLDHWSPHRFERIGNICVLPPAEPVLAKTDTGFKQTAVICHLRPEPMREWFDGDLEWTNQRLEGSLDIRNPDIRNRLQKLANELVHPGLATDVLIGVIAMELTVELGRYCTAIKEGPTRGGLAPWRLRLIEERLREVSAPPTLPDLARLCNLSVRALTRGFRVSRNVSIGEFVENCRVDLAKQLLSSGASTKATAHALGYASSPSFCYAFRRATGETSGEFRARLIGTKKN